MPNSPNCSSPLTNADSKTFTYAQSGSAYDSPILCHDQSQKDAYENVLYANSSSPGGCCPRSRAVLQRSNSENRDGSSCRHQEHSYENVRFQRGHRSELTPSATAPFRQTTWREATRKRGTITRTRTSTSRRTRSPEARPTHRSRRFTYRG